MKGKDLVKLLQQEGWRIERINGSHQVMKSGDVSCNVEEL